MKPSFAIFSLLLAFGWTAGARIPLDKIKLPPGFQISVYAQGIKNARSMAWGEKGTLFVGSREVGNVYAVTAGRVRTIASGLRSPNGVAFHEGALYVAEISRVIKFPAIEQHLDKPPKPVEVIADLPRDEHHGWKFIAFGPDKKLYVPVGAPCNICAIKDPYAAILRFDADGKNREIFARGIRNTVGFDWHPQTKELWFTDNGRDMMGDDIPTDELNSAPQIGMHFGYPFCHEGTIPDPEYAAGHKCSEFVAPKAKLGAHVAALGMRFYTGSMFPADYKKKIFIAQHGSWNRSKKSGYQIITATLNEKGEVIETKPFATGWMENESAWGRPVDILMDKEGALLVSDDEADAIYRITYKPRGG